MSRDEPAAWQRLARIRRTPAVTLQWLVASTVGFFAFAYCFGLVLVARRGHPLKPIVVDVPAPETLLVGLVVTVASLAVVVALHERIHGLFLARYGGEPRYSIGVTYFGLPYAYATVVEGDDGRIEGGDGKTERDDDRTKGGDSGTRSGAEWGYARDEMLVVLLAPFVLVTLAGLLALALVPSPLLAFVLAANAAGSVADLWMAAVLLGYPPSVRVGALPDDGFGIYGPRARTRRRRLATPLLAAVATGTVGTYAVLVAGLGLAVLHSLAFGSGTVVVDLPGRTLFRHELSPDRDAVLFAVDAVAIAGLSALGGLGWLVLAAPRRVGAGLGS